MRTKKTDWSQLWKRNAVVAAIALFVCAAVYLNWNYGKEDGTDVGKTLGQSAMVGGETKDPLVNGSGASSSAQGAAVEDGTGDAPAGTNAQTGGETGSSSAYFATARLNRQQARDSALSLLQDAAAREDADEAVKNQLNDNIQTMANYTVTEAQIENLVVAKGYADCVAFIGEDTLSLAVSTPEGGLTEADTAKILDVVKQTAGFTADQITIIEVE
ncbi:SpoIIIAH-like family protein [Flintibacter muris]|uniref:SpoIIIAH-like family protein n=1 Tax=Flintibacter muris TaxID=2941327 RepID=UPI00203CD6A2|nr:SpoIIIAH-like family protein [Flintibacter muris]